MVVRVEVHLVGKRVVVRIEGVVLVTRTASVVRIEGVVVRIEGVTVRTGEQMVVVRIQRAVSYCEYSEQIESGEFLRVFNGFTALSWG